MGKNKRDKKDIRANPSVEPECEVVCSHCGTLMRFASVTADSQLCVICHARLLNQYFYNVRKRSDGKRNTPHAASE